jgi:uncharacterized protein with ATP-grasp and redox domains
LTRGLFEVRTFCEGRSDLEEVEAKAMRAGVDALYAGYSPDVCSAILATEIHRGIYLILGTDDPYSDIKKRSNQAAKALLPKARQYLDQTQDKLEAAVIVSIVGNLLDFGIEGVIDTPEALAEVFDDIVAHGLDVNDLDMVRPIIRPGAKILYLPDNAGEIVFDVLTCEVLRSLGAEITVMVKGAPILTDVTLEDASETGMDEVADKLLTTGSNAVGLALKDLDADGREALFNSDLVISKGMANYEALSEPEFKDMGPILYVLRAKCEPVAEDLGVEKDQNVALLWES